MSVPQSERSHPKLEVIVKAMELASYTIHITSNQNIFKPEYKSALTDDLVHCAKEIYTLAWKANNINATKNEEAKIDRERFQRLAIATCYEMLALIQLAKPVFHLESKRVKHWGYMTLDCRRMLKAWKESDSKRYNY